jgi:cell division protein FtsI (penicillin-binding protein 3)/stage V sporulation protein D (sporulation-specific penicillin-binding protein)
VSAIPGGTGRGGSTVIPRRIGLLFGGFFLLLVLAFGRTAWLAVVEGGSLKGAATRQQVSVVSVPAPRGAIVDRHGSDLAVSEQADDVGAVPYLIKDPVATAHKLAPLLGRPEADVLKAISQKTTFVYLARELPADQALAIQKLELPGIDLTATTRREYPRDWLASQVLGGVGTDGHGLSGLEWRYDKALEGTAGTRKVVSDALGTPISVDDVKTAKAGSGLRLTLDANIQQKAEQVLGAVGEQFRPKGATAIVMDPNTGDLLAVANWPRVDANAPSEAPDYAHEDRAVAFNYEPGSTFKAFTIAGALQDGVVTPSTLFDLPPTLTEYDRTIHEAHRDVAVTLSTAQILAQSSNIGAIKIGQAEGADSFARWVTRFGFGEPTGVDLPGEERGIVLPRDQYSGASMLNMPMGQGISVTPMQMAVGYAALANGGKLVTPRIVSSVGGQPVGRPAPRRVVSTATAASLRKMLEGVFAAGGTAHEVTIPGYSLAGKTGTANKIDPDGGYSDTRYIASFVGFAPALHPKLLVSVMVDEPHGDIYGASVAAPAFGDIMRYALPYLKIAPDA